MMPISGVNANAVQPMTTTEKVLGAPKVQQEEPTGRQVKPMMDEYIPEEPQEPSGRYWMGRDENGRPKIYFDDPEQAADTPQPPENAPDAKKPDAPESEPSDAADEGAKGPERKKDEVWECNSDKVDREIEKLKKKKEELEQRLRTETDEAKIQDLERQLAQVSRELTQKDNDTYRKRHSTFRRLS